MNEKKKKTTHLEERDQKILAKEGRLKNQGQALQAEQDFLNKSTNKYF